MPEIKGNKRVTGKEYIRQLRHAGLIEDVGCIRSVSITAHCDGEVLVDITYVGACRDELPDVPKPNGPLKSNK